ncbi:MAG: orotate phosphoribosyltransferase [Thermotogae bacterium]|nr:orotate phosphoribosyltransferase [Thermotogota bacterium]
MDVALRKGHFLLSSGLHSEFYFEKFRILENPSLLSYFSERLAEKFAPLSPNRVVGPFSGGAILAYDLARILGVKAAYAEKMGHGRVLRRGFDLRGERVVVVDDVYTTGRSLLATAEAVKRAGGEVVALGVMVLRGEVALDVPFFYVLRLQLPSYKPEECPLCAAGVPLRVPGRGST